MKYISKILYELGKRGYAIYQSLDSCKNIAYEVKKSNSSIFILEIINIICFSLFLFIKKK